jgi:hypothetical protein
VTGIRGSDLLSEHHAPYCLADRWGASGHSACRDQPALDRDVTPQQQHQIDIRSCRRNAADGRRSHFAVLRHRSCRRVAGWCRARIGASALRHRGHGLCPGRGGADQVGTDPTAWCDRGAAEHRATWLRAPSIFAVHESGIGTHSPADVCQVPGHTCLCRACLRWADDETLLKFRYRPPTETWPPIPFFRLLQCPGRTPQRRCTGRHRRAPPRHRRPRTARSDASARAAPCRHRGRSDSRRCCRGTYSR